MTHLVVADGQMLAWLQLNGIPEVTGCVTDGVTGSKPHTKIYCKWCNSSPSVVRSTITDREKDTMTR